MFTNRSSQREILLTSDFKNGIPAVNLVEAVASVFSLPTNVSMKRLPTNVSSRKGLPTNGWELAIRLLIVQALSRKSLCELVSSRMCGGPNAFCVWGMCFIQAWTTSPVGSLKTVFPQCCGMTHIHATLRKKIVQPAHGLYLRVSLHSFRKACEANPVPTNSRRILFQRPGTKTSPKTCVNQRDSKILTVGGINPDALSAFPSPPPPHLILTI